MCGRRERESGSPRLLMCHPGSPGVLNCGALDISPYEQGGSPSLRRPQILSVLQGRVYRAAR